MNLLISGGTGFIGQALCRHYRNLGSNVYNITVISRKSPAQVKSLCGPQVQAINSLKNFNQPIDVIINLAGEPIADKRWSKKQKKRIYESRIHTTEQLIDFIKHSQTKPSCLISGSAIGFYGDQGDTPLTEISAYHDEFTHQLCAAWESCALQAEQFGLRVCLLRTGLVVGSNGGFLSRMLLPFRLGLGGYIGSGQQIMSWVHIDDLIAMLVVLTEQEELSGVFNGTAPNPVSNKEFSQSLAQALNRSLFLPIPAFVLQLALGEMSRLLLTGQKVLPSRFQQLGFDFKYPRLDAALNACTI